MAACTEKRKPRRTDVLTTLAQLVRQEGRSEGVNLAPAFTALLGALDNAAKAMIGQKLGALVPGLPGDQRTWFEPYTQGTQARPAEWYKRVAQNLRKTLLFQSGLMPMGLLRDCLDYALNDNAKIGGVFDSVKQAFLYTGSRKVLEELSAVYDFRNTHIAHQESPITEAKPVGIAMGRWIRVLVLLLSGPPAHAAPVKPRG